MENTNALKTRLHRQGAVLIPAIAYGDAAGLPFENQSAEEIAVQYGRVGALMPASSHTYFSDEKEPGVWSDDTQLSIAVAEGLIASDGFDLETQARTHLVAYEATKLVVNRHGDTIKRGWGGSTIEAMEKLKQGINPTLSGIGEDPRKGAGNGVLMKMAPLAYWQAIRGTSVPESYSQYDQLTNMTHNSPIARLTTRVHGDMLAYLLRDEYDRKQFISILDASLALHEFHFWKQDEMRTGYLRDQLKYLYDGNSIDRDMILSETDGKGFFAPQTLAMAYGAFMAHDGEFTSSVYEAVNLGGDTDSTASIVAAMSAFATKEVLRMPIDHQNIDKLDELKRTSSKLAKAALKH